jgi:UDP-N-acetylmuramoylalanine--D-glutamate ligase
MTSRDYFKGKRVAVIGLGHHGEMVEDVKFLIKAGALVSVYDLKSEARLKNHLVFLRTIGLANYVCGSIPHDDLLDMDMIVLSHEYSKESTFLNGVRVAEKEIAIEYPETLFFKQAPPVTVVGVIGACGRSTLLSMIKPLLEVACVSSDSQRLFVIDPESNEGILTHLKRIKNGDIVLMKMTNLMMKEMQSIRISPHVAVFVSLPIEESYDKSPFEVLSYQTYNNFIIASDDIVDMTHSLQVQPKAKMLRTKASMIPVDWGWSDKYPAHIRDMGALALQTASLFKVDTDTAQDVLLKWKSPKGRIELIKKVKNIEFYNDSASISPIATELAIKSLSHERNIILIMGGAKSEGCYGPLYEAIPKYVHSVILLPGSGTILERKVIDKIKNLKVASAPSMEEAVRMSLELAKKGDIVLFSPAFEAVGVDVSRKERGERFVRAVRGL